MDPNSSFFSPAAFSGGNASEASNSAVINAEESSRTAVRAPGATFMERTSYRGLINGVFFRIPSFSPFRLLEQCVFHAAGDNGSYTLFLSVPPKTHRPFLSMTFLQIH